MESSDLVPDLLILLTTSTKTYKVRTLKQIPYPKQKIESSIYPNSKYHNTTHFQTT